MTLERSRQEWEELAALDPLWAILSDPAQRGGRWDLDAFLRTGAEEVDRVLGTAEQLGYPHRKESALDFGCGVGRLTRALAAHFATCCGVDISERMLEQAHRINRDVPGCRFVLNTATDLRQFEDRSFDLVYSAIVLQHLPSLAVVRAYVREFIRVIRPGGLVVFQLPYLIPWRNRIQPRRRAYTLGRTIGLSERLLYDRLGLNPISMRAVPRDEIERIAAGCGARVALAEPDTDLHQPIRSYRYYVHLRDE
ncbi:MAG TPA: class I SAM-dependent methyltransferase [Chloroflexota bacterium]|nr:class I SAM-dependent methyltransferase [Chloroflexota bacterium]